MIAFCWVTCVFSLRDTLCFVVIMLLCLFGGVRVVCLLYCDYLVSLRLWVLVWNYFNFILMLWLCCYYFAVVVLLLFYLVIYACLGLGGVGFIHFACSV